MPRAASPSGSGSAPPLPRQPLGNVWSLSCPSPCIMCVWSADYIVRNPAPNEYRSEPSGRGSAADVGEYRKAGDRRSAVMTSAPTALPPGVEQESPRALGDQQPAALRG